MDRQGRYAPEEMPGTREKHRRGAATKRTTEAARPSDLKTVGVAVQFPRRDVLLVLIPLLAFEPKELLAKGMS